MADVPASLIQALCESRRKHSFPSEIRPAAQRFATQVLSTLFPHFAERAGAEPEQVEDELVLVHESLCHLSRKLQDRDGGKLSEDLPDRFLRDLTEVHALLTEDADAIFHGDPAARSVDEVILTYPGFFAIAVYRVAHALHLLGYPLLPRLLTEFAHEKTGVDIHPGARIGRRFVIDHGTGVVIGETTLIGNRVKVYQGVTLGAVVVTKEQANRKRHPTIEDDVVIYAGATILGGDTVVGHDSVVAGNAWLTQSVPPFSVVSRRSEVRPRTGPEDEALDFII